MDRDQFNAVDAVLKKSKVHCESCLEKNVYNEYWSIDQVDQHENESREIKCASVCEDESSLDVGATRNFEINLEQAVDEAENECDDINGLFEEVDGQDVEGSVFQSCLYVKFGSRPIHHDTVDEAVGYLAHCGLSKSAISSIIEHKNVHHFPNNISAKAVNNHFREVGLPLEQELAQITKLRLNSNVKSTRSCVVGEVFQLDACEPDFSKLKGGGSSRVIASYSGFTRAVICVCEASGFCFVEGSKKINENAAVLLERIILEIKLKFPHVKKIKADVEFWSKECRDVYLKHGLNYEPSPPNDHRGNTGLVESTIRRMQDLGQLNMNNLTGLIEAKKLTPIQALKLWFHAMYYARIVMLLYPSFNDESKTRYECGYGVKPDLNTLVLMPFGSTVVNRVPQGASGRGSLAIYIGPSTQLRGGINVFSISTKRVQSAWSYKPVNLNNTVQDLHIESVAADIYAGLEAMEDIVSPEHRMVDKDIKASSRQNANYDYQPSAHLTDELPAKQYWSDYGVYVVCNGPEWVEHQAVFTMECEAEDAKFKDNVRPLKPVIPSRHEIYRYPRWREAIKREVQKLFNSGTLKPRSAESLEAEVIMTLIPVFEYKWKMDPVTGSMIWLECCRIVINGSTDTRLHDSTYAETPEQSIVLVNLALSAQLKQEDVSSDADRAYLQADQTKSGVVVVPCDVLKKTDLGNVQYDVCTAMYGDKMAALQWQWKAENDLLACGCEKCISTRSCYIKKLVSTNGESRVRIVRHSDDFLFCGINDGNREAFNEFINELRSKIVMCPPKRVDHLLGYEVRRINYDGTEISNGSLAVITMSAKIRQLYLDCKDLINIWNCGNKCRCTPCHQDVMRKNIENANDRFDSLLNNEDCSIFRSILGKLMYISMSYRYDIRFTTFALSLRSSKTRNWDLKCALWCVEYLYATRNLPLVLGGESQLCSLTFSDATLGTAHEGRSIRGHFCRLSDKSGAVYTSVHCLKCAVKSVFHPELSSCADGVETSMFMCNVLKDFQAYDEHMKPMVYCDNEAVVKWLNGDKYNVKTRGLDTLFYSIRHLVHEDIVEVCHIDGASNPSDLLTKILPVDVHWKHTKDIMGLHLLEGVAGFENMLNHERYFD